MGSDTITNSGWIVLGELNCNVASLQEVTQLLSQRTAFCGKGQWHSFGD